MLAKLCLIPPLLLAVLGTASAQTAAERLSDKEVGWHWYKDPREKKEVPPPEPPPAPPPPEQKPPEKPPEKPKPQQVQQEDVPFSVAWLRKNLPRLRDEAIENPDDKDKVRAYFYAQRILMDKAQNFSKAAYSVTSSDPLLDETSRVPIDTAAKLAVMRGADRARGEALKELATRSGIFFFFDSRCQYCHVQQEAMAWLAKDYGFQIKNISVDGKGLPGLFDWVKDDGQAKALGLTIMPSTVFVVPPNNYYVISQGYHAGETLANKIMLVATDQNLLSKETLASVNIFSRGVLPDKDMKDPELIEAFKDANDTTKWVRLLRERYGYTY